MNPPSLAELTAADPFYPMYHAIRVINLAKRCGLVTFLTGTQEDLAGWDRFVKGIMADSNAIKNHKNAVAFGSPQAFLWLDIFKPLRKSRRVPHRAKKT